MFSFTVKQKRGFYEDDFPKSICMCAIAYLIPYAGIIRIRFNGYDLSLSLYKAPLRLEAKVINKFPIKIIILYKFHLSIKRLLCYEVILVTLYRNRLYKKYYFCLKLLIYHRVMKLQRFNIALLLAIILGLTFSSCDTDDYYWQRGTLDIEPVEWQTDNRGNFDFYYDIYRSDITNINAYDYTGASRLLSSQLWIESSYLIGNDRVNLSFEAEGRRYEVGLSAIEGANGAYFYNDDRDTAYAFFMDELINRVISYGNVRLYITGNFNRNVGSIPFLMTIKNILEAEVRN